LTGDVLKPNVSARSVFVNELKEYLFNFNWDELMEGKK
jgi:hypothetical protein